MERCLIIDPNLSGYKLLRTWEQAKHDMTMFDFAKALGRTHKSVDSEIDRERRKVREMLSAKVLVFDIEIAPIEVWVWGIYDQHIKSSQIKNDWFMLSWAAKWLGDHDNEIMGAVLSPDEAVNKDDKRICADLWELFDQADVIIAHNCKRFDNRKARYRFLFHQFPPPLPYKIVDTLQAVRKEFGATSNELDYLNKHLGMGRKSDSVSRLLHGCMSGNKQDLDAMLSYNINDVLLLEPFYLRIRPWMSNHPNMTLYDNKRVKRCPQCGSRNIAIKDKLVTTSDNAYPAYRCLDCDHVGRTKKPKTSKRKRKNLLK